MAFSENNAFIQEHLNKTRISLRNAGERGNSLKGLSTGYPYIDMVGGNTGNVLFPFGVITEIYGKESSGKTTIVNEAIANYLFNNDLGKIAYLDFENSMMKQYDYLKVLGVDIKDENRLVYFHPEHFEDGAKIAESLIMDKDIVAIVFDTVAAMIPQAEKEKEFGMQKQKGLRGRLMAELCRKLQSLSNPESAAIIFINQEFDEINFNEGYKPKFMAVQKKTKSASEGSLKFYAVARYTLRVGSIKKVETFNKYTQENYNMEVGHISYMKGLKNKVGTPKIQSTVHFYKDLGVDPIPTIWTSAINSGLLKKGASGKFSFMYKGTEYDFGGVRGKENLLKRLTLNRDDAETLALALSDFIGDDFYYKCIKEKFAKYERFRDLILSRDGEDFLSLSESIEDVYAPLETEEKNSDMFDVELDL